MKFLQSNFSPPFLTTVSAYGSRLPWNFPGRKRRRRRGKRGGIAAKLKLSLVLKSRHGLDRTQFGPGSGRFVVRRSLEVAYQWILPVTQDKFLISSRCGTPRLHHGGVKLCNLCSLCRAAQPDCDPVCVRMALVNARSLVHKTFTKQIGFFISD